MKPSPHLLLLGYGNVAQALLPLLATRSAWMEQELGIQPLICGIGSRRSGFFVHPTGLPATTLTSGPDSLQLFRQTGQTRADALAFLHAGRAAGATMLLELTTLNPTDGEPALDRKSVV